MRVSNPTMRAIADQMEREEVVRWANSLSRARVTRWGGMISTPDDVLQVLNMFGSSFMFVLNLSAASAAVATNGYLSKVDGPAASHVTLVQYNSEHFTEKIFTVHS